MNREQHARVWFYYANGHQVGPVPLRIVREALADGSLKENDYVYREGFRDWKLIKEVPEVRKSTKAESGTGRSKSTPTNSPSLRSDERRYEPRAPIHELVVAHNDSNIATGTLRDISSTGVFLQTDDMCFALNDEIKVSLKEGKGLGKPLHLRGVVVRQSRDSKMGQGYGLEIRNIDEKTRTRIMDYVKRNKAS